MKKIKLSTMGKLINHDILKTETGRQSTQVRERLRRKRKERTGRKRKREGRKKKGKRRERKTGTEAEIV